MLDYTFPSEGVISAPLARCVTACSSVTCEMGLIIVLSC